MFTFFNKILESVGKSELVYYFDFCEKTRGSNCCLLSSVQGVNVFLIGGY